MTRPTEPTPAPSRESHRVTLRGPAELADALPYLLGYYPDDSVVLIGLHGRRGRLGGRIRTGIPQSADDWPELALRLASCLVDNSLAREGRRPDAAVVYLCREPAGDSPQAVTELLGPLAQSLRTACGALDVPVHEALHLTRTRFWSYCGNGTGTPGNRPPGGGPPWGGTSAMAAVAARAGIRVRGSLRDLERALAPLASPPVVARQTGALDLAATELVPRMLAGRTDCAAVREETLRLAERMLGRFRRVTGPAGTGPRGAADPQGSAGGEDARDDALLTSQDAARLILGLQDRVTRDRAAEWMEGAGAAAALRLWRALARRCVGAYAGHAAAPLTLAGWVAWSTGDDPAARIALSRALEADPDYTFARLLLQACNSGLDPEPLRRCMRRLRADRRP